MKIKAVHIVRSDLPKIDKDWKFALRADPVVHGWVLAIEDADGLIGYGYGPAQAQFGAPMGAVGAALEMFRPRLIGQDSRRIAAILDDLDRLVLGINQAKSAVDCALHDLKARRLGIPIHELLGGAATTAFATLRILPIKKPADMAANARRLFDEGVRHFKIKVEGDVEVDVACVGAVREELGAEANLTIDANQSYSPKSAIQAITRMAAFKIDLAEQPVPIDDLRGLKLVTDSVPVVIEADESADSLDQVALIARERAADAVSLKISKLGGLRNTLAAARICESAGIRYRFGAHTGPQLLAAQALQLAATLPGIWYASELTEWCALAVDPWSGLEVVDGVLKLPTAPGCGVVPSKASGIPLAKPRIAAE